MYTKTCYLCGKKFTTVYHNQVLCTLPHPRTCASCGKTFYVEGINKDRDWCSDECRLKLHGKKCELCGKMFLPKSSSQRVCKDKHCNVCVVCGNEFEIHSVKDKDKRTCCKKCSAAYRKQTGEYKKYAAKARKTIQERYGGSTYNVSKKERVCEECGQLYVPSSNHQKWCNRDHYRPCVICGNPVKVTQKEQPETCSDACRVELIRRTCTEKYGEGNYFKTEDFDKKRRQTCLDKYGVDHYSKTDEYVKKYKESSRTHYGVDNPMQSDIVKSKVRKSNNERYGCDWYPLSCDFTKKVRETSLQRYGVTWASQSPSAKARRVQTVLNKYGCRNPQQNEEVRKRTELTNIERYGYKSSAMSPKVKKKQGQTNLLRYGNVSFLASEEGKRRVMESVRSKYNVDNVMFDPAVRKKQIENSKRACYKKYGVYYHTQLPEHWKQMWETCERKYGVKYPCLLPQCQNSGSVVSKVNVKFHGYLEMYGIESEYEFRVGNNSYDIGLESIKTLIELNPVHTHNSYCGYKGHKDKAKDSNYHLNKSKLAEKYGYRCIHVWDWDDWEKVVNLVLPTSRRLYARTCRVVELDKEATDKCLSDNHLQGTCKGQTVRLGLTYNDELVEVMTFGKPRYNRKFEWEILRLCALPGTSVVGGPSRLFSHFVKKCNPESVLSYCDRSKFTGNVYESIGMTLADEGTPNKHWYSPRKSERMQHITNNFLLQRGFDQIFGTSYGKGTSNEQLMLERCYLPVYDCGQMRFEWHK